MDELVKKKIINAFSGLAIPKGKLCNEEYDYDNAHGGFTGTNWQEHDAAYLRMNEGALSFFTPEAFRYYLPAFMMAELSNPETADIIAEGVAFHLTDTPFSKERIATFNKEQLLAIIAFFECCANRYKDGIYDVVYKHAAEELNKAIKPGNF